MIFARCAAATGSYLPAILALAVVVLLVGQAVWLRLHNAYEGPAVLGVGSHGLAVADLGVPPSVAIGIAVLVRRFRR